MSARMLDTNILFYAQTEGAKGDLARRLMSQAPLLSVQNLNEFALAARRRLQLEWSSVNEIIEDVKAAASEIAPLTVNAHDRARKIAERYRLQFYDSLLLATALEWEATEFLSEDMQDGLLVEERLTIRNPFTGSY